ncbi:bromodomain-containing protein DDB_G0280777 [Drosophila biarmipes]|uniref:bromodomain-containing protein DDB_G0280777 n=1 Tax=Drosophila biarmipes TaxID=125945 RepID=UPI0007E5DEAC|nr:bromodomain-containing protein DDB_G0280777 [Drosophila biarmipes]
MRLFLIGLLALGSARAFSVVRTAHHPQLVAYAPARGEFPVVSGLAQGYVRYYDGTGAERLLPYNYPEPLNGIRDLASSSLVRSGVEQENQQIALFRAWCEQRYQAMRQELDRLKEQGLKPTPQLLAQFEPLEQIVKFAAFEAVPGLSPEVQRARDEQLRIWNEARLEVLRAEQAQQLLGQSMEYQYKKENMPMIYGQQQEQQFLLKTSTPPVVNRIETAQTHSHGQDNLLLKTATQAAPQPVEETPEVKLARQEHLKQFNEALLRQTAQEGTILKTIPGIQQPVIKSTTTTTTFENQPMPGLQGIFKTSSFTDQQTQQTIEETPEVKRAREEHLKLFNEALLRQPAAPQEPLLKTTPIQPTQPIQAQGIITFPGQQAPQPVQETPEVKRAREEHLKQFNEAILRQPIETQQQQLLPQAPIEPFIPQAILKSPIADNQAPQPVQDTPEVQLAREQHLLLLSQAKVKAEDKVADIADMIRLEERELEKVRLQDLELRKQEEKEAQKERQQEADRLREETRLLEAERLKIEQEDRLRLESEKQELIQLRTGNPSTTTFEKNTPEYLRKAEQFKIINNQVQPQQQQPNIVTQQQQVQNGFFLRIQTNEPNTIQPVPTPVIAPNPFLVRYTAKPAEIPVPVQTILPLPLTTPISSDLKAGYTSSSSSSTSELDKATREHFRAHEIALEQLRVANLKNPWTPDCQH